MCSRRAPEDYRRGAETLKIRAEADKSRWGREVPLSKGAREALDAVCPDAGYLFPRMKSGGPACYRMTLRKAAREAGLAKDRADRISDYDFRHGRVTHLVEKTGNILGAGFLAGHKHATTTNTYLHARSSMAKSVLGMVAGGDTEDPHLVAISDDESAAHQLVATLSVSPTASRKPRPNPRFRRDTVALIDLREARQTARSPNPATSLQCEEQDLNLHTLRYRNLKQYRRLVKYCNCLKRDRQEQSGHDQNRLVLDTGVAEGVAGVAGVERALVDALVAWRGGDVVGVRRALLRALLGLE